MHCARGAVFTIVADEISRERNNNSSLPTSTSENLILTPTYQAHFIGIIPTLNPLDQQPYQSSGARLEIWGFGQHPTQSRTSMGLPKPSYFCQFLVFELIFQIPGKNLLYCHILRVLDGSLYEVFRLLQLL